MSEFERVRRPMNTLNAWLLSDGDDLAALGNVRAATARCSGTCR